jgi:hypothetical protein
VKLPAQQRDLPERSLELVLHPVELEALPFHHPAQGRGLLGLLRQLAVTFREQVSVGHARNWSTASA